MEKEIYALTRLAEAGRRRGRDQGRAALRPDGAARALRRDARARARVSRSAATRSSASGAARRRRRSKGRFREFYQCDIDIINRETALAISPRPRSRASSTACSREMAIGEFRIRINNRKVLKGLLQQFRRRRTSRARRAAHARQDRKRRSRRHLRKSLERRGRVGKAARQPLRPDFGQAASTDETFEALWPTSRRERNAADRAWTSCSKMVDGDPRSSACRTTRSPSTSAWCAAWTTTPARSTRPRSSRIPSIGSICSGGRYDDLASYFTNTRLPGRRHLDRSDAAVLEAEGGGPAAAARADAGGGARDHDGRPLSCDQYLEIATRLRVGGHQYRGLSRAGEASASRSTYADRKGFRVAVIAGENEFAQDKRADQGPRDAGKPTCTHGRDRRTL